ncbi:MAG TPA: CPBP family glutamic-type intramembrane protease [Patescibacteria group bacterium]
MKTKEFIITSIFIVFCLFLYWLFPVQDNFQKVVTLLVFFVFLPIFFLKIILKKPILTSLGIRKGDFNQGIKWSIFSLAASGALLWLLVVYTNFLKEYYLPRDVAADFWSFLFFELGMVLFLVFVYEVFFRGFVFFRLESKLGYWAIAVQFAIFLVFVLTANSSIWLFAPYLVFAPFAGIIACKSRSILYSGLSQMLLFIIFDANIVRLIK